MEIKLKSGIDRLLFGMREKDVKALYGEPDRTLKDEEQNIIYLYNKEKMRLSFYEEEGFRLGYIISSNPALELSGNRVIDQNWDEVAAHLKQNGLVSFERESFDSVDNYFNEDNWVIFQVEYGEVIRVELGATINSKDEFDWKF